MTQVELAKKTAAMKAAGKTVQRFAPQERKRRRTQAQNRQQHRSRDANGDDDDDDDDVPSPELVWQQELLCLADLKTIGIPYRRETIWRKIKAGDFPKPVKFGTGPNCRCFFRRSEIQEWIGALRPAFH